MRINIQNKNFIPSDFMLHCEKGFLGSKMPQI